MHDEERDEAVKVAVADDDPRISETVALCLKALRCDVRAFTNPNECLARLIETPVDVLITDLDMPGMDGLTLMRRVKEATPSTDVIVVTGNADKSSAIQALKLGAYDFFEKPVDPTELRETLKRTVRYRAVLHERDRFAKQILLLSGKEAKRWGINAFVGGSPAMRGLVGQIARLQGTDSVTALIRGESGTGKELVARAIHYGGVRGQGPFVPVNCAAIPAELVESALFGHMKGAFTGAIADRQGALKQADKGTLFLDEVGDMPKAMQAKLLRVIEDGLVTPVGSAETRRVDVRVIAATNVDLEARVGAGKFREDLYFRIAVYSVVVPPLRERLGDIPALASHFAETLAKEMGLPVPEIGPEVLKSLGAHSYPGNVRELRNVMARAIIECGGLQIGPQHVVFSTLPGGGDPPRSSEKVPPPAPRQDAESAYNLPLNLLEAEKVLIARALAKSNGNMAAAARMLGITRSKLYRRLAVAGIDPPSRDQEGT